MKLVCFKQDGVFYITNNVENKRYYNEFNINNLVFNDGLKVQPTNKQGVYIISEFPIIAKKKTNDKKELVQWNLKEGYPVSDVTPKVIDRTEDMEDYSDVIGLYTAEYKTIEGEWLDEELEVEFLGDVENISLEKPKYPFSIYLINQLRTHPLIQESQPCFISGVQLYPILRAHIKKNINPLYARITSDYDFCLTVEKVISHEPISKTGYKTEGSGRRKREVPYTKYIRERVVKCFETSPEGYSKYPILQSISALNRIELEQKIDKYLDDVICKINEPLIECPNCKGYGVINVG